MKLPGQRDEWLARFRLHIRRIHDRQARGGQSFCADEMQDLECIRRRGLAILIVGNEAAAIIRRQHFGRLEMLPRKARLPGTGWADQDDEGEVGNC